MFHYEAFTSSIPQNSRGFEFSLSLGISLEKSWASRLLTTSQARVLTIMMQRETIYPKNYVISNILLHNAIITDNQLFTMESISYLVFRAISTTNYDMIFTILDSHNAFIKFYSACEDTK